MIHKIIIIVIGIFLAGTASASALKVAPPSLQINSALGKPGQEAVTIENPGLDVALFEAYPDDFSEWINVNPTSFVLNPGEKKKVQVSANFEKQGVYATTLSIVSKSLSSLEFKVNAGVKIPLEIKVSEAGSGAWLASVLDSFEGLFKKQGHLFYGALIVIILILLIIKKRKSEQQ